MIGTVLGAAAAAVGVVATTGAAASVWRGVVRGVGRVFEGDPVAGLKEIGGGFAEPVFVAGTQILNLCNDAANVTVYAGARVAGLLSPKARELTEQIGGFDNTLAAITLAASLPKLGPPPEPTRTEAPGTPAAAVVAA